jgi:pyrimidine-nucleoside phosphorylase
MRKREGLSHGEGEIRWWVDSYLAGKVVDYQMSAWLMAVCLKGLSDGELCELLNTMIDSGARFSRKSRHGCWVDKHSTGGVGDKTSIVLVPLVAAAAERLFGKNNLKIPMVSGRGLGHTGGTVDKLESVEGFRTQLSIAGAVELLEKQGFCMMAQTDEFVPADRKLYALRDASGTIESVPLIVASIMSKKLSENLDALVLDIKVGSGAFMKSMKEARLLGESLVRASRNAGVKTSAWITDMNEPLGRTAGNLLEIDECWRFLDDPETAQAGLKEVVLNLGASMIALSAPENLSHGKAFEEIALTFSRKDAVPFFERMLVSQGASIAGLQQGVQSLKSEMKRYRFCAPCDGWLSRCDAFILGNLLVRLGAGRGKISDAIDSWVGFEFEKKIGDKVARAEPILTAYLREEAPVWLEEGFTKALQVSSRACCEKTQWLKECLE